MVATLLLSLLVLHHLSMDIFRQWVAWLNVPFWWFFIHLRLSVSIFSPILSFIWKISQTLKSGYSRSIPFSSFTGVPFFFVSTSFWICLALLQSLEVMVQRTKNHLADTLRYCCSHSNWSGFDAKNKAFCSSFSFSILMMNLRLPIPTWPNYYWV